MHLLESGEMYLETIYILMQKGKVVRSIDIAEQIGYKKPSISRAVGLLKNGGYISVDNSGHITLTDSGLEIASKIYERHTILTEYLVMLGVDEKTAAEDACKIEQDISDTSFNAIKKHVSEKIHTDSK